MPISFQFSAATPQGQVFEGVVVSVAAPGLTGSFGVLGGHAPMFAELKAGIVKIETKEGESVFLAISGGIMEIKQDQAVILADSAARAADRFAAEHKVREILSGNPALDPATW